MYGAAHGASGNEVEIEAEACRLPIKDVVTRLVALAGVVATGSIGNVKSERTVRHWLVGDRRPEREPQLRFAFRIASMVASVCGPHVVQSWFQGANTALADRAPALVLRDDFSEKTQQAILNAARRLRQ